MANQFIKSLGQIEGKLGLVLGIFDLNQEIYYTAGPGQTWVHPLREGVAGFEKFLNNSANTGAILSPIIIIQALLYFLKAGIGLYRMAAERKPSSMKDLLKIAAYTIAGVVNITLAVALLIGFLKLAAVMYVAQEAVGWVKSGIQLAKASFSWFRHARKLKAFPGNTLSANSKAKLERIIEQQKELAKNAAKKLTGASLLIGLTVLSLLPIPIVSQVSQLVLFGIVIIKTVQICKEHYAKYKAKKAKQAQEQAEAEEAARPQSSVINTLNNIVTIEPVKISTLTEETEQLSQQAGTEEETIKLSPGKANNIQATIEQSSKHTITNLPVLAAQEEQKKATQPNTPNAVANTQLMTEEENKKRKGYGGKQKAFEAYLKHGLLKPTTKITFSISGQGLTPEESQASHLDLKRYSLGN